MQISAGAAHGLANTYIAISADGSVWSGILKANILKISSRFMANYKNQVSGYAYKNAAIITINMNDATGFTFDIQDVTNQPTWTPDINGLNQAVQDITNF